MTVRNGDRSRFQLDYDVRLSLPERVCLGMVAFGGALLIAMALCDVYFLR